jgi:protein-disulfide isomerase
MKRNVKLSGLILLGTLVVVALAVLSVNREASPDQSGANKIVVMQPNTHILQDAGDGAPILVEFLDFECEACGAFYPYIEELKKEFETEITFAFRYFPLPGHSNAFTSALAVEGFLG